MIFETLAERTLATAQLARRANPELGYEVLLDLVLRPILADCINNGITISATSAPSIHVAPRR